MGDESHLEHIYTDARLDPDGEMLPTDRYMVLKTAAMRRSNCLIEKREACILESKEMNDSAWRVLSEVAPLSIDNGDIAVSAVSAASSDSTTL
jgi:hypothetical protein